MGFLKKKNYYEKKMYEIQKAIDLLNKLLDSIAKFEKDCLDDAAEELEEAARYEGINPKYALRYKQYSESSELTAKYHASKRPQVLDELEQLESLKKE